MRLPRIFGWRKPSSQTVAVCDIGSGSVAVAIVEAASDGSPARVLVSERRSLAQEERTAKQAVGQLKTLAQEAATAVLGRHARKLGTPPGDVIAIVHAPWVRSETASFIEHFDQPTLITEQLISDAAKRAVREDTKLTPANMFERSVMRIAVSGYPTAQPEGKTGDRLEISVLQSDIQQDVLADMKEALGAAFVGRPITFHSAFFVLSVVIKEFLPNISHYTLVDVTSLATSSAVVRQSSVVEHAEAAIGWRTVLAELAKTSETTPEEAFSRVRMAADDSCTDAVCQSVLQSLHAVEPQFVSAYGNMLNELAKTKRIPALLILLAPPDLGGWFARIFSRIDFSQFAISEQPFTAQQLFSSVLAKHVEWVPENAEDAGVAVGAGFVHMRARSDN